MNKEFVPYKEALALKELGFDEECLGFYIKNKTFILQPITNDLLKEYLDEGSSFVVAPLYQQAFRWFREKYDIHSNIRKNNEGLYSWTYNQNKEGWDSLTWFKTYEEAELGCLRKLIEIVKDE